MDSRFPRSSEARNSITDVAKGAAEDLLDLLTSQIKLARVELAADARAALMNVARIALFVPVIVVGYAFALAALAGWLAQWLGVVGGIAVVGGLQMVVGILGAVLTARSLRRVRIARASTQLMNGVQRTVAAISSAASSPTISSPHQEQQPIHDGTNHERTYRV